MKLKLNPRSVIRKISIWFLTIVLILFLGLLFVSPQKTSSFIDDEGNLIENSIAEINTIMLNGVEQRILIRGKDLSNPILLHLHGGPGSPDHPLIKRDNRNLEDIFTVCYWDQRGAGASYSNDIPVNTMSLEQIVQDGEGLTKYLLETYHKKKIYLEAHSWGTAVGTSMVIRNPELYHAYFGIGQMVNSRLAEQKGYDFTFKGAKKAKDKETLKKLAEIGRPPYESTSEWLKNCMIERKLMKNYLPQNHQDYVSMFNLYKDFIFYREYSIEDKLNALRGDSFSMQNLWQEAIEVNLFESNTEFKIPMYFFQGEHDQITVSSLVKEYYKEVKAPRKEYYSFENATHYPQIEEFEKYKSIIKTILLEN